MSLPAQYFGLGSHRGNTGRNWYLSKTKSFHMPRMFYFHGSGICLLLSSIVFGQAPTPKNLTLQQVVANRLQQQRQWGPRHLPRNSVRYSGLVSPTPSNFSSGAVQRSAPATPPVSKTYGPTPTQPAQPVANLQSYLQRDRIQHSVYQRQWGRRPNNGLGSPLLRSVPAQPAAPPR